MDVFTIKTEEELDIIYHSYRMKIIRAFSNTKNGVATFKQIADILGDNSSKVTYHGKKLLNLGILKLSHTEEINGITAKYFKLVYDSFDIDKSKDLTKQRDPFFKNQITQIITDALHDIQNKVVEVTEDDIKHEIHLSAESLYLTEEEFEEFNQLIHKYMDLTEERENAKKVDFLAISINEKARK